MPILNRVCFLPVNRQLVKKKRQTGAICLDVLGKVGAGEKNWEMKTITVIQEES